MPGAHSKPHPLAGKPAKLAANGLPVRVLDWFDRWTGDGWRTSPLMAAQQYVGRRLGPAPFLPGGARGEQPELLPDDDEVVYADWNGGLMLFHDSEIAST